MVEHKNGKKTYEDIFFSFMRLCSESPSCNHSCFYSCSLFLIAAAIITAIHGQKILHWPLSKVILSGMCNCNFEAIS